MYTFLFTLIAKGLQLIFVADGVEVKNPLDSIVVLSLCSVNELFSGVLVIVLLSLFPLLLLFLLLGELFPSIFNLFSNLIFFDEKEVSVFVLKCFGENNSRRLSKEFLFIKPVFLLLIIVLFLLLLIVLLLILIKETSSLSLLLFPNDKIGPLILSLNKLSLFLL